MAEIVRTEVEEYAPIFNEDTGEYIDSCPYENILVVKIRYIRVVVYQEEP